MTEVDDENALQLLWYAFVIAKPIEQVSFLSIADDVKPSSYPFDANAAQPMIEAKIESTLGSLIQKRALPANGTTACATCSFEGLCRKSYWSSPW